MMLPGIGFTRASWSAYWIQNGVMKPSTSRPRAWAAPRPGRRGRPPAGRPAPHRKRPARYGGLDSVRCPWCLPRSLLDRAILPEGGDLVAAVSQLAQDLVGVLAVGGRGAANRAGRARQRGRQPLHQHLAALGMAHGLGHAEVLDLLVVEHFLHVQDRPRR